MKVRKKEIRHVSSVQNWSSKVEHARGATEFASSKTAALVDARDWKPFSQHLAVVTEAKGARPAVTVLQICRRNGSRPCCGELSWPAFNDTLCELTTLHRLFRIQGYIMANTSSHGIMNITWLWIVQGTKQKLGGPEALRTVHRIGLENR